MEHWVGRVAIVTGASSGIGAAIAKMLAEKGMKVVGVARRVDKVKSLAAEVKGELHAIQCDVKKEEDIIRVVKWTRENLGGVDVLVNNAGTMHLCPLTSADTSQMKDILDTNVLSLCVFSREVLKCMKSRGVNDGHIIHIGSSLGHMIAEFPGSYVYTASKHAVRVLTEGLRRELRDIKSKTRVTEISPGLVETELAVQINGSLENRHYLAPRDIAEAVVFSLAVPPHVQIHEMIINPIGKPASKI